MKRNPSPLYNQTFDLLVCGGGVYGAWTAYDAALRGLKVALIDQGDWGSATSSASSKLIHGGLRYLEQFEFKLVRKTLSEREMLMKVAPHRVWPLRFGVPVYAQSRVGLLRMKLGLMLYDFLAVGQQAAKRHRFFNRLHFAERFPWLNNQSLKGGFTYADAQTDDARLVLELVSGAMKAGAVCVNYCRLTSLQESEGRAAGANIHDVLTNSEYQVHARQIVYAAGHWVAADSHSKDDCLLTRGIHLIMPGMHQDEALLLTAQSDGRVFFVIPWYGLTLLGTTDTPYLGPLDQVNVEKSEIAYLLSAVNNYLQTPWTEQDIIGSFAGVRVLKQDRQDADGSSAAAPSSVSRDWVLKTAANGVHYSIGGKLTSARQDAALIVDQVCAELNIDAPCATQGLLFPWTPLHAQGIEENFSDWSETIQEQAVQSGVDPESATWLIRRHGCKAVDILHSIKQQPALAHRIIPAAPFIDADLMHCAAEEMVVHLDDLLRRRIPLLILAKLTEAELRQIITKISGILNWHETRCAQEFARCRAWLHS
ncbi:glycerol-3-phosphate dehydrogenase/oxidase [Nitrosomonas aestuarii]|uniref:glycerol-3-phosphate dehydrogenase/oxidase n=1 Tax=Nitrosomonas aestuarii TaxID=52441 RepID=UPI000D30C5CE|nr:glycerol-3-phosphate dehydrogenase/oxidase [Nitrosomonas aestuarii]PTN12774.1 glycerol-3-phosphate dehydrogenase [Nitrosomonas aestuarii]